VALIDPIDIQLCFVLCSKFRINWIF